MNHNFILEKIVEDALPQLELRKKQIPLAVLKQQAKRAPHCKDFTAAFEDQSQPRIIAELKNASPSKGIIRPLFEPVKLALELEKAGAAALSILTEENYFLGHLRYLQAVAPLVKIPILRKDFIFDPYQVYEARAHGADAILLIAALLKPDPLRELAQIASDLGLSTLGEAHNETELETLLASPVNMIGINARNLNTFETDLEHVIPLIQKVPTERLPIAESAIQTRADIETLHAAGAQGFLIGETLMRSAQPGQTLRELIA